MIGRQSFALAAAIIVCAAPGLAAAADLPPPPPLPVAAPVEIGGSWYLRGDYTESWFRHPKDAALPDPNDPGLPPLVGVRMSREGGYGGGIGYRINPWLRVDATFDQRSSSDFRAFSSRSNFATGYNVEAGKIDVLTGLVNIYADLGTWYGFTPYIGAGIGFAEKNMRRNYTQTTCLIAECDGVTGSLPGPRDAVPRPNHSVASFAWALTAGLSYDIGAGFTVDAAYRYVDLGRSKSGLDAYGFGTRVKDLASNEFRIGLRYSFSNLFTPGLNNPYGN
ncbi:outer membrane protein [Methylorubrum sp. POS3]|uniref:outer membrane protein n=1 Tax=Methylorubrum sp. POS3 TaxID=2998492 RepID=UPI00372B0448